MTLPASGAIDLFEIADEFGLARSSTFPGAFYGKGGAPASGPLSFADFYGRSNVQFSPDGGTVSDTQQYAASVEIDCNQSALWTYSLIAGSGVGTSVNVPNGTSSSAIIFGLSTTSAELHATWSVSGTANGVTRTFTVDLNVLGDFH